MPTFSSYGISSEILKALDTLGFTKPTEIQSKAIPLLLEAKKIDFHGQAQTGTGKTVAFGIPLLEKIDVTNKHVQGLVVAPTRELVLQIAQSLQQLAQFTPITIEPIYGGISMGEQIRALKRGVHIIVGTPGRLNDHLRRKTLSLQDLKTVVLDEADIMLDMGFKEEVDEILSYAPKNRQIWLFSATVKPGITEILSQYMHDPVTVRVHKPVGTPALTEQYYCIVPMRERLIALCRFIDSTSLFYGFIFCRTKILTAELAEQLVQRGYKAAALHGDMSQAQRNRVIKLFKQRDFTILLATDVAARGIDVPDITHVINYSLPEDIESYVHRIGRTGRAGKKGIAITFINHSELRALQHIERKFNFTIKPVRVPTLEQIGAIRLQEAAEYLAARCHRVSNGNIFTEKLQKLVQEYPYEELTNAVVSFLNEKFFAHLKEEEITFTPSEKHPERRERGRRPRREGDRKRHRGFRPSYRSR